MAEPIDITTEEGRAEEQVKAAFGSPTVSKIYANGFYCGRTNSDLFIALQLNGTITTVLNLSYTCAKSLQQTLGKIISDLEIQTDHSIMTMTDVMSDKN